MPIERKLVFLPVRDPEFKAALRAADGPQLREAMAFLEADGAAREKDGRLRLGRLRAALRRLSLRARESEEANEKAVRADGHNDSESAKFIGEGRKDISP